MKRFFFVLLAVVLMACTQDRTDIDNLSWQGKDKIYASINENEVSRVQLNEEKQTVWTEDDVISVFNGTEYSRWQFDGQTGDRSGTFTKLETGSLNAVFDPCCAFYSSDMFSGYGANNYGTPAIFATISSTQNYLKDSYGLHTNAMFGTSDDGVNFKFTNLFGYLRLSIAGDKRVESIRLVNNSGGIIAGELYFLVTDPYSFSWYSDKSDSITLDCGDDGVQLSSTPTDFYFVLPPSNLSEGITVVINFTDGSFYPQSTSKAITIARNTIQPMSVISTSDTQWQSVYITCSGSSVVIPVLTGTTSMSGCIYWGDSHMSLLGETDEYNYQDGEESHVIAVQAKDANSIQIKNCTGISQIDLSNF